MVNSYWIGAGMERLSTIDDVDIWHAWLDQCDAEMYKPILSREELDRAMRYVKQEHSARFIKGRGLLRGVLSEYLHKDAKEVGIVLEDSGKPILAEKRNQILNFSVSHSKELFVLAVSKNTRIGIDVENIDPNINPRQTAMVAFSHEEIDHLQQSGFALNEFFEIWTCKEAVLKATGTGFSHPSNSFSVISSEKRSLLPRITGEVTQGKRCAIRAFSLFGEYTGALATIL